MPTQVGGRCNGRTRPGLLVRVQPGGSGVIFTLARRPPRTKRRLSWHRGRALLVPILAILCYNAPILSTFPGFVNGKIPLWRQSWTMPSRPIRPTAAYSTPITASRIISTVWKLVASTPRFLLR